MRIRFVGPLTNFPSKFVLPLDITSAPGPALYLVRWFSFVKNGIMDIPIGGIYWKLNCTHPLQNFIERSPYWDCCKVKSQVKVGLLKFSFHIKFENGSNQICTSFSHYIVWNACLYSITVFTTFMQIKYISMYLSTQKFWQSFWQFWFFSV